MASARSSVRRGNGAATPNRSASTCSWYVRKPTAGRRKSTPLGIARSPERHSPTPWHAQASATCNGTCPTRAGTTNRSSPRAPQRDAARIPRRRLHTVERDLDDELGAHVHDVALLTNGELLEARGLPR